LNCGLLLTSGFRNCSLPGTEKARNVISIEIQFLLPSPNPPGKKLLNRGWTGAFVVYTSHQSIVDSAVGLPLLGSSRISRFVIGEASPRNVFYAIAVYAGYRVSFRQVSQIDLTKIS